MKTTELLVIKSDPVISEVRQIKMGLAARHNFDVVAMVRSLQERERKLKLEKNAGLAMNRSPNQG